MVPFAGDDHETPTLVGFQYGLCDLHHSTGNVTTSARVLDRSPLHAREFDWFWMVLDGSKMRLRRL